MPEHQWCACINYCLELHNAILFQEMNSESSRSHLVIAIVLESTNLTTGAVTRGKLSLVDLAGSERVGKTGATAQQLKVLIYYYVSSYEFIVIFTDVRYTTCILKLY